MRTVLEVRTLFRCCVSSFKYLPSPLLARLSFVANREVSFLTRHALFPPVGGLCNRHSRQFTSGWRTLVNGCKILISPRSGSSPCPAGQVGILSQYSQMMGEHCRPGKQRHGSSATGFSGRSMKPLTMGGGIKRYIFLELLQEAYGLLLFVKLGVNSNSLSVDLLGSQYFCWRQRIFSVQPGWYSPRLHLRHLVWCESVQWENTWRPGEGKKDGLWGE